MRSSKGQFRRGQHHFRPDEVLRPVAQDVIFRSMIFLAVRLSELKTLLEVSSQQHVQKWRQGQPVPSSKYLLKLIGHIIDEAVRRERLAGARLKESKEVMCRDCMRAYRARRYEQLAAEAQHLAELRARMVEAATRLG